MKHGGGMELLTAARMRAIETAAITSGEVTGRELMERAAAGLVARLGPRPGDEAAVLCGPGNNGGDGYAVARLLAAQGARVTVFEMTDAPAPPDAALNRRAWIDAGGEARPLAAFLVADAPALLVDALFGTGLARPLCGDAASVAAALAGLVPGARPLIVAADIPSGLCADSGRALGGAAFVADVTVSFHGPKAGHHLADGPAHCGVLEVVDIGLTAPRPDMTRDAALVEETPDFLDLFDKGGSPGAHKFSYGHALILSGGVGSGGAARLAARGALRIGAGVVTLGCPPAAVLENAGRLDAIMLRRIAGAEALEEALTDPRITALGLGMGLGLQGRAQARTLALLEAALRSGRPCVLDADALTALAGAPDLAARLHAGCVLTPHMGEFARLFPDIAARLAEPPMRGPAMSRIDAARAAALRAGCTVLLKGPDTVVATALGPDAARADVHSANYDRAAPWLATAGAGDVLAGMIAGLLARGAAPHDAACRAAWLHARAARLFGPGLIAEDLPDMIPRALRPLMA
ncbi:MAG: hydroxyethylthiazole kinase-like uncharacterized protein yjeF [Paracoccaceae bacterium]|jgi:hydroxyethylthiazole kinase-like uncharacterized protein yjeF